MRPFVAVVTSSSLTAGADYTEMIKSISNSTLVLSLDAGGMLNATDTYYICLGQ